MSTKRSTRAVAPVIPDLAKLSLRSVFRSTSAKPVAAESGGGDAPTTAPPAEAVSVLRFDASHPEVRAFAQARGWSGADRTVSLLKAELTFTTDGWTTTRTAALAQLPDGSEGFRLAGVVPGTELEFAIHAELGLSAPGAVPHALRLDTWFNNGGSNYRAPAEGPSPT